MDLDPLDYSMNEVKISEVSEHEEYLDLGSLRIPFIDDMKLELDLDQETNQVVSVSISIADSIASIQAFSAPSDEDAWPSVRDAILSQLTEQHVETKVELGRFGTEIHSFMPTLDQHGVEHVQDIRFVGIDGPRWFLRCTIGGMAAKPSKDSELIDNLIATIKVIRGDSPMPPGELLPLEIPNETL